MPPIGTDKHPSVHETGSFPSGRPTGSQGLRAGRLLGVRKLEARPTVRKVEFNLLQVSQQRCSQIGAPLLLSVA
jgi:hypothetical protein